MSIPDALLWSWYELLTDLPAADLAALRRRVEAREENPRDAKARLARRITADFHGGDASARAAEDFRRAFSRGEVPDDVETKEAVAAGHGATAARALVALGMCTSMPRSPPEGCGGRSEGLRGRQQRAAQHVDPKRNSGSRIAAVLRLGRRFTRVVWK